jgi:hypothetical protein
MNNTFRGHSGKTVGECPVCKHTVYKEQSRTKIGGMMLRNKVRQFPPVYNVSIYCGRLTLQRSGRKRWKSGTTRTSRANREPGWRCTSRQTPAHNSPQPPNPPTPQPPNPPPTPACSRRRNASLFSPCPAQLDDDTFRAILMPLRAAAARGGGLSAEDVVSQLQREITALETRSCAGVAALCFTLHG